MRNAVVSQFVFILISALILFQGISFSQLTGVKTIPGNYATFAAAVADLNAQGVGTGGVTFNVSAGFVDTLPSPTAGLITATGTQSNPIVFQKSGVGLNSTIYAGTGTGTLDAIIVVSGGDYITFDGINFSENPANLDNNAKMEWGYALLKRSTTAPADGCNFIDIKNSTITLDKLNTSTWGIYAANHTPQSHAQKHGLSAHSRRSESGSKDDCSGWNT